MKTLKKIVAVVFIFVAVIPVFADTAQLSTGNGTEPSLLSDTQSYFGKGNWVFTYEFTRQEFNGLLDGTKDIQSDQIVKNGPNQFLVSPTSMFTDLHFFEGNYGMSKKSSLHIGIRYLSKSMDVHYRNEQTDQTNSNGLGDTQIGVTYGIGQSLIGIMNLNLPTGGIAHKGELVYTSESSDGVLPYNLQLGSGTFDINPSLIYTDKVRDWGWGVSGSYQRRLTENRHNYRFGNEFKLLTWGTYAIEEDIELQCGLSYLWVGEIKGEDIEILQSLDVNGTNIATGPMNNPDLYGGQTIKVVVGFNTSFSPRHKVRFDLDIPLSQNLNGPQLKSVFSFRLAYQFLK